MYFYQNYDSTVGYGSILALYQGQQPHLDLVDRLNLSDKDISVIRVHIKDELSIYYPINLYTC